MELTDNAIYIGGIAVMMPVVFLMVFLRQWIKRIWTVAVIVLVAAGTFLMPVVYGSGGLSSLPGVFQAFGNVVVGALLALALLITFQKHPMEKAGAGKRGKHSAENPQQSK